MSATLYLLARAYPTLLIVPALNIPLVNGIFIRIGTNVVESLCIRLPIYILRKASTALQRKPVKVEVDPSLTDDRFVLFEMKEDPDFPDFESIEMY